jgi:hypothetical protein
LNIQNINLKNHKKEFLRSKNFSLPEIKVHPEKKQSLYDIMLSQ